MATVSSSKKKDSLSLPALAAAYGAVQEADRATVLWEYRFNAKLLPALYRYLSECVFCGEKQGEDFREGFPKAYAALVSLTGQALPFDEYLGGAEAVCRRTSRQAAKERFWFFKTGGAKIGVKLLRKIVRQESDVAFGVVQDGFEGDDDGGGSVFDTKEACEAGGRGRESELPGFLKDAQVDDFKKIADATDALYVERTFGKSEEARQKADADPASAKKYLSVLLTSLFLELYEAYKVIPFETFLFILRTKHFYDARSVQEYRETGEIISQKRIAGQFGLTEAYLSGRKRDFFARLRQRLSRAVAKDSGFFASSIFTGFFARGRTDEGKDDERKGF